MQEKIKVNEWKLQAHKEFDEKFSHTRIGKKMVLFSEAYPYTYNETKSFISSIIDKTVQMTEERIVEDINKLEAFQGWTNDFRGGYRTAKLDIIPLITNKSDINNLTE